MRSSFSPRSRCDRTMSTHRLSPGQSTKRPAPRATSSPPKSPPLPPAARALAVPTRQQILLHLCYTELSLLTHPENTNTHSCVLTWDLLPHRGRCQREALPSSSSSTSRPCRTRRSPPPTHGAHPRPARGAHPRPARGAHGPQHGDGSARRAVFEPSRGRRRPGGPGLGVLDDYRAEARAMVRKMALGFPSLLEFIRGSASAPLNTCSSREDRGGCPGCECACS
ncbi:hypothetical protein OF83DRAFT_617148 [Amylostereum chailletii]|nr:hypothetical protein OF83DRAFT_617148 [Amylostereum chailletii]